MSYKIQKARDILDGWLKGGPSEPWQLGLSDPGEGWFEILDSRGMEVATTGRGTDQTLITGTTGNPGLLAVLESILASAQFKMASEMTWVSDWDGGYWSGMDMARREMAKSIAGQIIEAEERMNND